MTRNYPYVMLPKAYKIIEKSLPLIPEPHTTPKEPHKPTEPVESSDEGCMSSFGAILSTVIGFIAIAAGADHKNVAGLVLGGFFLIMVGGIALYIKFQAKSELKKTLPIMKEEYRKAMEFYSLELKNYIKQKQAYSFKMNEYEAEIVKISTSDYIRTYRVEELKKYFKSLPVEKGKDNQAIFEIFQVGIGCITSTFEKKIIIDDTRAIIISDTIELEVRMCIPYNYKEKHVYTNSNDAISNNGLSNNKRFVILFAEEQIILNRRECVSFINYIISEYSFEEENINDTNIRRIKFWTLEISKQMAQKNFRSTYLQPYKPKEYLQLRSYFDKLTEDLNKQSTHNCNDDDDLPF